MVIPTVQFPGTEIVKKPVEIVTAETYTDSVSRLFPLERKAADSILKSFNQTPSTGNDQLLNGIGTGTCLARFRNGLFIIYQIHVVSNHFDQSSHKQVKALFCWRSENRNGVETISFPEWAGA